MKLGAFINHVGAMKTRRAPLVLSPRNLIPREVSNPESRDFTLAFSLTHPPSNFDGFSPTNFRRRRRRRLVRPTTTREKKSIIA